MIMTTLNKINVINSIKKLDEADKELLRAARKALKNAYAPYSNFQVGAALRLKSGIIVPGSNQENASYPLCLCAERAALAAAANLYPKDIPVSMAITVKSKEKKIKSPATPCGACRQVIAESEFRYKHPIRIILQGESGPIFLVPSIKDLLPLSFDGTFL